MDQGAQPRPNKKHILDPTTRLQLRRIQKKARERQHGAIDWEAAHQRLAAAQQADLLKLDQKALLQERTLAIARPLQTSADAATASPLVVLRSGNLQLAVEVEYVREIITLEKLTR